MPAKQIPQIPPAERVQESYKKLALAAPVLNSASDELCEAVSVFDAALRALNLGVSAWVTLSQGHDPEDGEWWSRDLGYARIGDSWGIALSKSRGNIGYPDRDTEEQWLFKDGPRWMRLESVGKIPDLLEALLKQTDDTTRKLKAKAEEVLALAAAMSKAAEVAQLEQK